MTLRSINVGVVSYILAALASISVLLVLTLTTSTGAKLFPQADHKDLLQALHAMLTTHF
jgi:hypothetical protein